jgi:ATP:ADP antiporter, AAA family
MKEKLFSILGIESGEERMIAMLLTQSVFLGIFFGAYDISAHSLFLSIFDEKKMAWGYVLSGIAGIILTSVYTQLQTRMNFKGFSVIDLSFVTALTLIIWIILIINPAKWVIFLVFIMLGPLNILAMLGFWGTVSRLFTLRQGKRLFGLVDAGLIVGIIISCYAIPVILSLNFKAHNILLISAAAILIATILQITIGSRFLLTQTKETKGNKETTETSKPVESKSIIGLLKENSYIRIIGIFIALSVMTAFFVQYSFMAVTREQYPVEEDMARFLGFFIGSMMIFTLLIKLTVFSYLIRNYGLRTCLAISPILIAAFTILAVVIGSLMGYTPAKSGFMIFFMILALSRLFSKSLKDSIESPSFKVIYLTFDEKTRYVVQSGMDGTVNEMAALTSGLLLTGLGFLGFIKLIHFSVVLIVISVCWIFIALKVYTEYRKSIRKALEGGSRLNAGSQAELKENTAEGSFLADLTFNDNYFAIVSGDYSCLNKYSGNWFFTKILNYADTRKNISLLPLIKKIASDQGTEKKIRERAGYISESLEHISSSITEKDDRTRFSQKLLTDSRQPQTTHILRLLRDNSDDSKAIGMMLIGKFRIKDMVQEVCECLEIPRLKIQAKNILRSFGSEASDQLQRYYLVSSGNTETSLTILRILAEEGSSDNYMFLFSRLWSNSRRVKEVALKLLSGNNFIAPDQERDHIHQMISEIIGIIVWNLSAKICLERNNDEHLLPIMNMEIARWNEFLFDLLSITYDSGSILRIKENLASGTVEGVNYALEMIDIVIDESIKPKITQLLDVTPDENKVKNLYQFYPGEIHDYPKLIDDILNRDYNLLGIWIRACALRNIASIENENLAQSVIALLFSPEPVLREESAKLVARSDNAILSSVSGRIDEGLKDRILMFINNGIPAEEMLYEKVRFLSDHFKGTDKDNLLLPANSMKYITGAELSASPSEGGFILWSLSGNGNAIVIHDQKEVNVKITGEESGDKFYLLPLNAVEDFYYAHPEQSVMILNYIGNIEQ